MIIRLVKMGFKQEEIENFRSIFLTAKPLIEKMDGCIAVNLHQDLNSQETFFTISKWSDDWSLEKYRQSELFITTWKKVKPLFNKKAEAWSLT